MKPIKIIKNTLKIEENSQMSKKFFIVGPKKVGSIGFPEIDICFWPYMSHVTRETVFGVCKLKPVWDFFSSKLGKMHMLSLGTGAFMGDGYNNCW